MERPFFLLFIGVLAVLATVSDPATAGVSPDIDYERQVKPLFKQRCYACHGALKQKGHLRLDTVESIRVGGDEGPAIEPGHASESSLLERLRASEGARRMPPEGAPLSAEQITLVQAWIDQGAKGPADEVPDIDPLKHWSFLPPLRPSLAENMTSVGSRSPIDVLLDAGRKKVGIEPLDQADPGVLLRRVSLDLTGLPPTRDELHEFLKDPSDEAYRKVVDRLLASPRYGERWARHWMDVWRYSDWYGRRAEPDVLNSYGQIWRWRDWIVRALNADRGYDSMVQSMLAADEITPGDPTEVVATGFLVRNFFRWNYNSWMKDNVEHTGKAFLSLTFNCAHCHDHKYDPIKQDDYFALRAIFDPIDLRHDRVDGEPDPGPFPEFVYEKSYAPITSGLVRVYDKNLDVKTYLYSRGESRNIVEGKPPIEPSMPSFLGGSSYQAKPVQIPPEIADPWLRTTYRTEDLSACEEVFRKADEQLTKTRQEANESKSAGAEMGSFALRLKVDEAVRALALADLSALQARISADEARRKDVGPGFEACKLSAARAEKWATVQKAALNLARAEFAADPAKNLSEEESKKAKELVEKMQYRLEVAQLDLKNNTSSYTPFSPIFPSTSTGRRKALAQWITERGNPLAARVAVNYIWMWHFGTPLVATTQDFGRNGASPTHPELLDWLAVELMEPSTQGVQPWSMKAIHRLIVTSDAYRMQSHPKSASHGGFQVDSANRSYWHFPRNRMESEQVRDSLLHVAGTLDPTIGGPDIDFKLGFSSHRRSLYFTQHGEGKMPFLETFNAPDVCDAYKRTASVVPQQALAMVNNLFLLELSQSIAERLWAETQASETDQVHLNQSFVTAGFESVLCRVPTTAERDLASQFLSEQTDIIGKESASISASPQEQPEARARRDLIHALFSHTDFLTIH